MTHAQDRIDAAGRDAIASAANHQDVTSAIIGLTDLIRQIAVEAFDHQPPQVAPEDQDAALSVLRDLLVDSGLECTVPDTCLCSAARAIRLLSGSGSG